jgi:nucleoside-diphosphate-sugar epimerase
MPRIFCFGLGYCATRLNEALVVDGWEVAGTKRSKIDLANVFLFDGRGPVEQTSTLKKTTHLLSSVPPSGGKDPVLQYNLSELIALRDLEWVGYLSATSVYGDTSGDWVDESFTPNPGTKRGIDRLSAEQEWLDFGVRAGVPVQIFRLSGIYGPGRSVFDRINAGLAKHIYAPATYFSRIHVEDIIQVILASISSPRPGALYNLADDEPTTSSEIIKYGYALMGRSPPPAISLADSGLSEIGKTFYKESRRVNNDRIKRELGVKLLFPNYRLGLDAIFNAILGN